MFKNANIPPENNIIELQTSWWCGRELICQGDSYPHMLSISGLTKNFGNLKPEWWKTKLLILLK